LLIFQLLGPVQERDSELARIMNQFDVATRAFLTNYYGVPARPGASPLTRDSYAEGTLLCADPGCATRTRQRSVNGV
jgi:hypothetical protein